MIDAVLFDLDGTLVDTAPDMARTVNEMLAQRGLPATTEAAIRPYVSRGARGMIVAAFGVDPADAGFKEMRDEFLRIYEGHHLCIDSHLFPGMSEVLDWLEKESIAWGVVTNKFARLATPIIDALGLADRARVVVGGDTCARAKPFPDPLLHAVHDCVRIPGAGRRAVTQVPISCHQHGHPGGPRGLHVALVVAHV